MAFTQSEETGQAETHEAAIAPHLFRVVSGDRLEATPSRHALVDLDEVQLGRGATDAWHRADRRLRLEVSDLRSSEQHARLRPTLGRWQLTDLGSKNGTLVNGVRAEQSFLGDGDLIEVGRTLFLFAAEVETPEGEPLDDGPTEPLAGMPTLVPWFAETLRQLARIAAATTPILLGGPTGSGKEVVARAVHTASGRSGRFVAVNCGALPRELVESTLFGHRRGAFSGAVDDALGVIRESDGGTLFLDELGDLALPAQAALLRVLQEREVTPVGATRPIPLDLRVVCATHRDLAERTAAGIFRADLLHRIKGFGVTLPPLAERRVDLGLLLRRLLDRHARGRAPTLLPQAARALCFHDWPGNVRELEQILASALALGGDQPLALPALPPRPVRPPEPDGERELLVAQLTEHQGSVRAVARAMGKDPVQIRRWLRRFGLDAASFRR